MKILSLSAALALAASAFPSVLAHDEADLVRAVLVAEAGGEGLHGMAAVLAVIDRRSAETGRSRESTLALKRQFSCLNRTTPSALVARQRKREPQAWEQAGELVHGPPLRSPALDRLRAHGATHFHSIAVMPAWALKAKPVAKVGRHLFYRLPL